MTAEGGEDAWSRRRAWQQPLEFALWALVFLLGAFANIAVRLIDAGRDGAALDAWQPATWELSSAIASLLLLPLLLRMCERWPLHADTWLRRMPAYLVASLAWCLLHVGLMVLLRMLVYAGMGERYVFDWMPGLPYEYLKDVRTFATIVFVAHGYSWLWRRLQGEVRLLAAPDPGIPAPAVDRPERFLVRKLGREFLVAARDVEWLQAAGNYVNLHVASRDYPLRSTMTAIEASLDPGRFLRIHRSYIVNIDRIASIEPMDNGDARVHLVDGNCLPCSRRYREALRAGAVPEMPPRNP